MPQSSGHDEDGVARRKEPRDWISLVLGLFVGIIIATWALWLVGSVLDKVLENHVPEVTPVTSREAPKAEVLPPAGNPADALMSAEDMERLRLEERDQW